VELHGGTVDVFSEGAGTGSEFTVRLPVAVATPEPSAAPVRAAAPAPVKLLRILVIDDNEDSAESLSMLLGIGGHEVRTAFSGAEGIDEFSRFTPDVVLCDIRMPDMSGFEVARRIRAHARGPTATLVALTGFGADADRRASSQAGFDHHVVKPADPEALLDIVRAAAQRAPESGVRPPAR
jgi:two-component system CheB/CheR fusion protein